jgi:hypothetical protein
MSSSRALPGRKFFLKKVLTNRQLYVIIIIQKGS